MCGVRSVFVEQKNAEAQCEAKKTDGRIELVETGARPAQLIGNTIWFRTIVYVIEIFEQASPRTVIVDPGEQMLTEEHG